MTKFEIRERIFSDNLYGSDFYVIYRMLISASYLEIDDNKELARKEFKVEFHKEHESRGEHYNNIYIVWLGAGCGYFGMCTELWFNEHGRFIYHGVWE